MHSWNRSVKKTLPAINTIIGSFICIYGLLVIIAWQNDIAFLKTLGLGDVPIKANAGACFFLSGISLIIIQLRHPLASTVSRLVSAAVIIIGVVSFLEIVFSVNFGVDEILFRKSFLSGTATGPTRMALNSSVGHVLAGILLLSLSFKKIRFTYFLEFCLVLTISISIVGLLGFIFGLASFSETTGYSNMAVIGALLFLLICSGILFTFYSKLPLKINIEKRLFAGLIFSSSLLFFIILLSGSGYKYLRLTSERTEHSQRIKNYLNLLFSDILDVETGVRGYLISNDEDYIESMSKAKEDLAVSMHELTQLMKDNQVQLHRLDTLCQLILERVAHAELLRSVIQSEGKNAGAELFLTRKGKLTTDRIRLLINKMKDEENRILKFKNESDVRNSAKAHVVIFLNLLIELSLIALIFIVIYKYIRQKNRAIIEFRKLNAELELKVSERTLTLAQSEENYRNMFANNPQPMWIYDLETLSFLEVNDAAVHHYGYSREEFLSMTLKDIRPSEDIQALLNNVDLARDSYNPAKEWRHLKKNGAIINVEIISHTITFNNRKARHVMVTDITERNNTREAMQKTRENLEYKVLERTSQLEEANKELESFSYSVSHDLMAPLRHINGFVAILTKEYYDKLPEEARHYLTIITDSAQKMVSLINDLLILSRTSSAEMKKTPVNMNQIVEDVISQYEPSIAGREIEWKIASFPKAWCDSSLLRHVWVNLIDNALKYTRTRGKTIIQIGYNDEKEDLVFYIRDNGVGFDMKYAQKLFGVFQRLHSSSQFDGTGIGLANVRRIINRHKGRTWAEGVTGTGATFYFTIPNKRGRSIPEI